MTTIILSETTFSVSKFNKDPMETASVSDVYP